MHYLALSEGIDLWAHPLTVLSERGPWLRSFVAEHDVQTNEVGRCWGLLPVFLLIGSEAGTALDLIELGPSAGLNLVWDRYRYRYGRAVWGSKDAPLELTGELKRSFPSELLAVEPVVRRRRGIDLNPIDVTTEDARLLECFVWADQAERLERLRRAIEVVREHPPELIAGDYVELLPGLLAERDEAALTVVFQTASIVYLTSEQREALYEALERAGREAPWRGSHTRTSSGSSYECGRVANDAWHVWISTAPGWSGCSDHVRSESEAQARAQAAVGAAAAEARPLRGRG